jgi:hypothetical protein
MNRLIYAFLLFAAPVLVAWFDWPVPLALLLVLVLLAWRQALVLGALMKPPSGPALELETILPSHFSEKGRWCLDRLGVPYTEKRDGGVIGLFLRGRTVPMLTIQTGRTRSSLCESSEILRFLYGRYACDPAVDAAFLEPTEERVAWERRLDRYGVDQQTWVYFHLLRDPALVKQAWGADSPRLPVSRRWAIKLLYPLLEGLIKRAFDPDENYPAAVERTEALLADTEALLSDGRQTLLGGDSIDYVDLTLASLSALWLQPDEFAAGAYRAEAIEPARLPEKMRADMARWRSAYPATTAHIERLYREERLPAPVPT